MNKFRFFSCIITFIFCTYTHAFSLPENCTDNDTALVGNDSVVWHRINCTDLYNQKQLINILDVDLSNIHIKIKPVQASDNTLEPLPVIANKNTAIIAGINGGYFYNSGSNNNYRDPSCPAKTFPQSGDLGDSLLQIDGRLITANCDNNFDGKSHFARSALAIDSDNNVYIQLVTPGEALKNLIHNDNENVWQAIGGGPNLISTNLNEKGFINILDEGLRYQDAVKAPRTAVGITADKHLLLVTIDGKSPHSGVKIHELADFMLNNLHASAALNLDGGGSTTMCIKLDKEKNSCEVVNHPSDATGTRKVHDGLFILYE